MAPILLSTHPKNHNSKGIFFMRRFFFAHRISKLVLNSWALWGVDAVKMDSTGCFDRNLSTSVPKGVEIVNHGIGFAPAKPSGDVSIKQPTIGN